MALQLQSQEPQRRAIIRQPHRRLLSAGTPGQHLGGLPEPTTCSRRRHGDGQRHLGQRHRQRHGHRAGGSVGFLGNGIASDGASVGLNNAVSGSTTGSLSLYQNAYAGNGGSGFIVAPGKGGSASSALSVFDIIASSLLGSTVATGGNGGMSIWVEHRAALQPQPPF